MNPRFRNSSQRAHEVRDLSVRRILFALLALLLLVLCSAGALRLWYRPPSERGLSPSAGAPPFKAPEVLRSFSQPVLESDPQAAYQRYRNDEERRLSTDGWSDRERGWRRIPVRDAIQVLLDRGYPVRKEKRP